MLVIGMFVAMSSTLWLNFELSSINNNILFVELLSQRIIHNQSMLSRFDKAWEYEHVLFREIHGRQVNVYQGALVLLALFKYFSPISVRDLLSQVVWIIFVGEILGLLFLHSFEM